MAIDVCYNVAWFILYDLFLKPLIARHMAKHTVVYPNHFWLSPAFSSALVSDCSASPPDLLPALVTLVINATRPIHGCLNPSREACKQLPPGSGT